MADKIRKITTEVRSKIVDEKFKIKHRKREKDFTRQRQLPFPKLLMLMLKKGSKSLQQMLNESMLNEEIEAVTAGAYSKARARLKHTAFIELNETTTVQIMYEDEDYQKFKGKRLLAVDGSKVILPDTPETIEEFGQISFTNGKVSGQHATALVSTLYDVLNKVALDSKLAHARSYEVDLAMDHLIHTRENDVIIADRNYASYRFISTLANKKRDFVIRCSSSSFRTATSMIKGEGAVSQTVTIDVPDERKKEITTADLPLSISVRFVRVKLKTGEYEVLVTSLLDESEFTVEDLSQIYHLRWGIEGFYGVLKTRLGLENFTGKSVESVYQDFYSTVFLTGLESVLTQPSNEALSKKAVKLPQHVNKAVSFNAIKNKAFDLLFGEGDDDAVFEKLRQLFLMNPVSCRPEREVTRVVQTDRQLLNYYKRRRKICY